MPCRACVTSDRDVPCQTAVDRVGQWLGPGQPGPQPLTFIKRAWTSPAPNPSLLTKGPGPAAPKGSD